MSDLLRTLKQIALRKRDEKGEDGIRVSEKSFIEWKAATTIEQQQAEIERLHDDKAILLCAMNSIANSSCCGDCQEAKKVAVKAIQDLAEDEQERIYPCYKRVEKLEKVFDAAKVYWDNTPDTTYSQAVALRDAIADAEASK